MRQVAVVGAGMTPFAEHFALGIKDLLPMAFAECAASVDKGLNKSDLQAAWFGAMGTPDGFPAGILADTLGLPASVMHQHKADMTTFPATVRAAKQAFAMASVTPADVDVAEVHDFFTGIELMSYEDLGFAERFDAYKLVENEVTSVGGSLPVNPSGGLKSKGHPPGATGVAQCVELFNQLRGDAVNQVDGARIGLAHNIGGPTAVAAVSILEGPGD